MNTSSSSTSDLPFDLTAEEGAKLLVDAKLAIKAKEQLAEQLVEFLSGEIAAGHLEKHSYEPGVYELAGLRLSKTTRTTWKYSSAIKALQVAEQKNGLAEGKTSTYWTTKLL